MTSPAGKYGFVEILTLFFSMLFLDYGMECPPASAAVAYL
jgi:hypothetical protein